MQSWPTATGRQNLSQVTFEDAKRCPKCDKPGRIHQEFPRGPHTVYTIMCETELCLWYNTTWVVQVNADGSIPNRDRELAPRQPKTFPKVNFRRGQEYLDSIEDDEQRRGR